MTKMTFIGAVATANMPYVDCLALSCRHHVENSALAGRAQYLSNFQDGNTVLSSDLKCMTASLRAHPRGKAATRQKTDFCNMSPVEACVQYQQWSIQGILFCPSLCIPGV